MQKIEPLEERALLSVCVFDEPAELASEVLPLAMSPAYVFESDASDLQAEAEGSTQGDWPDDLDSYVPMPLLNPDESGTSSGLGQAVTYDVATGVETIHEASEYGEHLESDYVSGGLGAIGQWASEEDLFEEGLDRDFSSLTRIDDPELFPWRVNVKIFMNFSGSHYVGSGVLIDPMHVLTAGHCVYSADEGGWATSIRVVPAYENGAKPYGEAYSESLHSWTGWTHDEDHDHDIGVIDLDRPIGALTSWYGYGYDESTMFFLSNTFHNPGYPSESPYDGRYMYYWYGDFDYAIPFSNQVGITSQGYGGQSGSGAYHKSGDSRIVYAVLSNGWSSFENFIRLTEGKFKDIRDDFIPDDVPSTFDLIPLNVKTSPGTIDSGSQLSSMSYVVHNYSSASWSGNVNVDIYLSDNDNITTSDTLLSSRVFSSSFTAKSTTTITVSTPPTIPVDTPTGDYYIGIIITTSDHDASNNDTDGWDAAPIHVNHVNHAPVVSGIPNVNLDEDTTSNNAVNLRNYASDEETADDDLIYTIVGNTNPNCGVTIDSSDRIDVNPVANWHGYSDVTVRVTDPEGAYDQDTFRVTVASINDVPVALDDVFGGNEDQTLVVYGSEGVLDNDSDIEGDIDAVLQSGPSHGSLTFYVNGGFSYQPNPNYHGTDSFTYKAYDGEAYSDLATVTLNVASVNDVPVALDDVFGGNEDQTIVAYGSEGVLDNDSDVESALDAVLQSGPSHGSLTFYVNGGFSYQPNPNYHGTDSFTYKAYDGEAYSDLVTVTLNVVSVNDVPVALDDAYACDKGQSLVRYNYEGVLINDSDADVEDTLTAVLQSGPSHGLLELNANGSFTYNPYPDYCGQDSFTYKAYDSQAYSGLTTVLINVVPKIPGDANRNGVVDEEDLSLLSDHWQMSGMGWEDGDFNNDGIVNATDASILAANWGATAEIMANEESTVDTAWIDGTGPSALHNLEQSWNPDAETFPEDALATPGSGVFNIYVESGLLASIQSSIDVYVADLTAESYVVTVQEYSGNAEQLRAELYNEWTTRSLEGALFVGDLPYINFTSIDNFDDPVEVTYPHDLYFMDLDGQYTLNASGPDEHTAGSGDVGPEIYMSRITTGNLSLTGKSEATLINEYFAKVHDYRTGLLTYVDRGIIFADDDWSHWNASQMDDLYDEIWVINSPNDTTEAAYLNALNQNYESILEAIHSWPQGHSVHGTGGGTITNSEILAANPRQAFYNMFNCSSAKYTASNNMIGMYVYGGDYGLNAVGSTKTGSMLYFPTFYTPQGTGASIGESFEIWFDAYAAATNDPVRDSRVDWFYGMTMQGDPTLRPHTMGSPADAYEPNDTLSTAYDLTDQEGSWLSEINGLATQAEDDWYRINVNAGWERVVVDCQFTHADGNIDIALFDATGTEVCRSDSTTDNEQISVAVGGAGTFYVRVYNGDASSVYDLQWHTLDNYLPVATDDTYACFEDLSLVVNDSEGVLDNDTDADPADILEAVLESGPSHGSLTLNADGSFTYVPAQDYFGTDSFTYKAYDQKAYSGLATVTLEIAPTNDAPIAIDDTFSCEKNHQLVVYGYEGVLLNDFDIDDPEDVLEAVLESGPLHGRLQPYPNGGFSYTPDLGYQGTDSFTYKVFDQQDYSTVATVLINVYPKIPGDANRNGIVGEEDLAQVSAHWGLSGMSWEDGDFNNDGLVNATDASILAANWGTTAETMAEGGTSGDSSRPADLLPIGPPMATPTIATRRLITPAVDRNPTWQTATQTTVDSTWLNESVGQAMPDTNADVVPDTNTDVMPDTNTDVGQAVPDTNTNVEQVDADQDSLARQSLTYDYDNADDEVIDDAVIEQCLAVASSSINESLHDAALVEQYGPQTGQTVATREQLAWSNTPARRTLRKQDRTMLDKVDLTDPMLTDLDD